MRQTQIRHVGLSEVSVEQVDRARRFIPVASVQNLYNLVDRDWDEVVEYCERERIAFIPWYPLQAGVLAARRAGVSEARERGHAARGALSDDRDAHHGDDSRADDDVTPRVPDVDR